MPAYKQTHRTQIPWLVLSIVSRGEHALFRSASGCPALLGDCAVFVDNRQLGLDAAAAGAYASEHLISSYTKLNIFDGDDKALFDANGKLVAKRKTVYDDLNWFDAVERTGYRQDYSISGSVASSKFNVYASLGYTNEQGYIVASGYERMTGRINTSFTPNKWFKAGVNVNATVSERNFNDNATGSYYANPFYIARYTAPIYPYYHPALRILGHCQGYREPLDDIHREVQQP